MNFREKLRKFSFMLFREIELMKNVRKKPTYLPILNNEGSNIILFDFNFESRQRGGYFINTV